MFQDSFSGSGATGAETDLRELHQRWEEPVFSRWVNHARSVTFTMSGEDVYTRQVYPDVFGWTDENNGGPGCRRCQDAKEV